MNHVPKTFAQGRPAPATPLIAALLIILLVPPSFSQSVWVGLSADLGDELNWAPNGTPSDGDSIVFNGSSLQVAPNFSSDFGGAVGLASLTIASGQTAAVSITNAGAAGSVFRLADDASLSIQAGAGAFTMGGALNPFALALGAAGAGNTFTNNSSAAAVLSSNLSLTATGGSGGLAIFGGTGNWTVSGPITSQVSRGLVKEGSGILTLSGANAYTGQTVINGGTIWVGSTTALGSTSSPTVINTGGTLDIRGFDIRNEPITLAGGSLINTGGEQRNGPRNITLTANSSVGGTGIWYISSGTLNLAGNTLTKSGSNQVFFSNSTVSAGTVNLDSGSLWIEKSNWATGTLNVASGATVRFYNSSPADHSYGMTINLANGSTLHNEQSGAGAVVVLQSPISITGTPNFLVGTDSLTLNGPITGTGTFRKIGAARLNLGGTNTYLGPTNIQAGTLALTSTGSITSAVTVQSGTTLINNGRITGDTVVQSNAVVRGSGVFDGNFTLNGTHNPGNSPGVTIHTGNYAIGSSATLILQLDNPLGLVPGGPGLTFPEIRDYITGPGGLNFDANDVYNSSTPLSATTDPLTDLFDLNSALHSALEIGGNLTIAAGGTIQVTTIPPVLQRGMFFDVFDIFGDSSALATNLPGSKLVIRGGTIPLATGGTLLLPDLWGGDPWGDYNWDLALFESHGVLIIVPEPSRALLLAPALALLILRRRRPRP